MTFSEAAAGPACAVFDVTVDGTPSGGTKSSGRGVVQGHCGAQGLTSGIVDFNYLP